MRPIRRAQWTFSLGLLFLLMLSGPAEAAHSSTDERKSNTQRIDQLERKVRILTREIQSLHESRPPGEERAVAVPESEGGNRYDMGESANRIYRQAGRGVSWAGYGEAHVLFSNEPPTPDDPKSGDRSAFFRQSLYLGYRFNDWLLINSELEVEYATGISLEFGYLDMLFSKRARVRTGLLLIPLGILNQQHEPPSYFGNHRPLLATTLIPTSMRENGIGLYGTLAEQWQYYLYVTNSLNATGLRPGTLAEARQNGTSGDAGART
ncbi:MAG TPA: hypothetical protein VKA48_07015, partial [Gammaproteobacteria bacterium]|nr:hypothetical protein [Gammaproteobacteria bacterium]